MSKAGAASAACERPLRVLLLEDSRFDAELVSEALLEAYPRAALQVVRHESAFHEALSQAEAPQVILSDYEIPGFSGAAALDAARRTWPHTPFIFVSGVIGEDNAVELLKRGATDYVSKARLTRLPVVLARALREAEEAEALRSAQSALRVADQTMLHVEARRLALIELSDRIRSLDTAEELAYAASELLGRHLGVDRAGYGVVDKAAETIRIERDWCAPGVATLAGLLHFRDYGSYIEQLQRGETVAIVDAVTDARVRDQGQALIAIGARAVLNMPLTEKDNLVGLLYLNHGSARAWPQSELEFVREVGERIRVAIARVDAQAELAAFAASLERQVEERTRERDRTWLLSQDLLGVATAAGHFESVNPAWEAVLGWSPAHILATPFTSFVHPEDLQATEEEMQRLARGERTVDFENRYRTQDGRYRRLSWTAVPDGERIYTAARDVTLQREREAELEAAREQLRQSQKLEAVGQLTGGLAHDFNNLLAAISGSLELMRRRSEQGKLGNPEQYIHVALGATKRAAALTHRLLAFSRRQTLDPKPLSANRLVQDMEELLRRTMGPQIEMQVLPATGLWPVHVDPGQLENALLNLCINARDAMPDGGRLTIETANLWVDERTAHSRDLVPGQYVSLTVSDSGVGMSPDVAERAVDPFFTTKPLGMGTGLGLSMIYGFAKQSGGQIKIDSALGQGTSVCIYLPRHHGPEPAAEEATRSATPPAAQRGETVLVVDDEAALRQLVVELMRDLGYETLEAGDGASALEILESNARIDLLLSDVGLPGGMNGRQLADAARLRRPQLRVLFITGYAENAVLNHGHLEPGMHVMTKPFEMDALARRVRELMERRPG